MVVNGPSVLFMLFMSLIWYCRLYTLYLSVIYRVERGNQVYLGSGTNPIYFHRCPGDAYQEDGLESTQYIHVQ